MGNVCVLFYYFYQVALVGIQKRHMYPACDEEEEVEHVARP